MTTNLERLQAVKTNTLANLEKMSRELKPSYTVGGMSYSWTAYQKLLLDSLESIDDAIDREATDGGIVEEITTALN